MLIDFANSIGVYPRNSYQSELLGYTGDLYVNRGVILNTNAPRQSGKTFASYLMYAYRFLRVSDAIPYPKLYDSIKPDPDIISRNMELNWISGFKRFMQEYFTYDLTDDYYINVKPKLQVPPEIQLLKDYYAQFD